MELRSLEGLAGKRASLDGLLDKARTVVLWNRHDSRLRHHLFARSKRAIGSLSGDLPRMRAERA
jgi:hypothetical protein